MYNGEERGYEEGGKGDGEMRGYEEGGKGHEIEPFTFREEYQDSTENGLFSTIRNVIFKFYDFDNYDKCTKIR